MRCDAHLHPLLLREQVLDQVPPLVQDPLGVDHLSAAQPSVGRPTWMHAAWVGWRAGRAHQRGAEELRVVLVSERQHLQRDTRRVDPPVGRLGAREQEIARSALAGGTGLTRSSMRSPMCLIVSPSALMHTA